MKTLLVLSCLFAVAISAPTEDIKQRLLELLRKELDMEEPEPQGVPVIFTAIV